ncbi:hypothetical protein AMAG_08935 [Allomyces macrogynus ATCC 38327]|uniref:Uncharacterized protein n=1 Tax=Allomyces macrogynus (strain ATCC 38327) TaxID=578462 RepID=A0A0L0SMT9_ALLM3|nr:hypothetical protein AMAG_08935 [Allomyces macrogynus ATCC 38327]|eukprot:KNE63871.1 hypothetical protein AMAG_08935 [Allomyces macrogynus ATCC 38327]
MECPPSLSMPQPAVAELPLSPPLTQPTPTPTPTPTMSADEMTALGEAHLYGRGPVNARDRAQAFDLFLRAANLGDAKATGLVGFMYEFGLGVPASFAQCEPYYQAAAARGHVLSMARLAYLKRYAHPGIKRTVDEANSWMARIRELMRPGVPQATWNAPPAWESEWSPAKTKEGKPDVFAWLCWAAGMCQCSAAQVAKGTCFYYGIVVASDPAKAVESFRKSADQGGPRGHFMLGQCYEVGCGVGRSAQQAFQHYFQAATHGDVVAMKTVGRCYEHGIGLAAPDYTHALAWYRRGAKVGNGDAANALGSLYERGHGATKDQKRAIYWYRRGAALGNVTAQWNLGSMYQDGIGTKRWPDEALKWLLLAAQQDHPDAMYRIGEIYQRATGVPEDPKVAVSWYLRAAKFNDPDAFHALAFCAATGYGGFPRNLNKALRYLDLGIRGGAHEARRSVIESVGSVTMGIIARVPRPATGILSNGIGSFGAAGPCSAAE